MSYKSVLIMALAAVTAFLLSVSAFASGVDYISYSSYNWTVDNYAIVDSYSAAAEFSGYSLNWLLAKPNGGLDAISYGGCGVWNRGTQNGFFNSTVYKAIAANYAVANDFLAAKASGGLDEMQYAGGGNWWGGPQSGFFNSTVYNALATNYGAANDWLAAKASGGLDKMQYAGGGVWNGGPQSGFFNSTVYNALATNYGVADDWLAAKASGGVDTLHYAGGGVWQGGPQAGVGNTVYTALASTGQTNAWLAAKAAGGVDLLTNSGGNWSVDSQFCLNPTSYVALARDSGAQYSFLGVQQSQTAPGVGALSGQIQLLDYLGDPVFVPIRIDLIPQVSGTPKMLKVTLTSNPGQYSVTDIAPGTYKVAFSAAKFLTKAIQNVVITANSTTLLNASLINGDVDGDNLIGNIDLNVILGNLNKVGD